VQIYLVGGAVRDHLLGQPVTDKDYVVVGATPQTMRELGYLQVGRDFPVFLHPQTKQEYALARTRRGDRLEGMVLADPAVSLEQDLARRDLTINAIAMTEAGELIDPFGGAEDLKQGCLRHVSDAFCDDPIRLLRVARFMARYAALGFRVADETLSLMREMVARGQLDGLVPERVWQELERSLGEDDPRPFFDTLRQVGALAVLLPELDGLFGVPQPVRWHPEIDCGAHTMMVLKVACELSESTEVRFAALTHDLGKAQTPDEILPSHHGHESRGERLVKSLCQRLKVPARHCELASICALYHGYTHRLYELRPKTVVKLLSGLDAFRRPERLEQFLLVCEADYRGRQGFHRRPYPQSVDLRALYEAASGATLSMSQRELPGRLIGEAITRARTGKVAELLASLKARADSAGQSAEDAKTGDIGPDGGSQGA
jgi:tRNA nucleotidyltransferase (CCA-adding enzyme)